MPSRNAICAYVAAIALLLSPTLSAHATTFSPGNFVTYNQGEWGDTPAVANAALLLQTNYPSVYASTFGVFEIGIPGASGFSIQFTNVGDLLNYLPSAGVPGPLTDDLQNPTMSPSGAFGGNVAALKLNVDFSDAGLLAHLPGITFGDLVLHDLTTASLNGLTVRQFLGLANTALGGGSLPYSYDDLSLLTAFLDGSFDQGFVTQFAQDHLQVLQAPTSVPESGSGLLLLFGLGALALSPSRRHLAGLAGRFAWRNRGQS